MATTRTTPILTQPYSWASVTKNNNNKNNNKTNNKNAYKNKKNRNNHINKNNSMGVTQLNLIWFQKKMSLNDSPAHNLSNYAFLSESAVCLMLLPLAIA